MPLLRAVHDPGRGQWSQGGWAAASRRAAVGCKQADWHYCQGTVAICHIQARCPNPKYLLHRTQQQRSCISFLNKFRSILLDPCSNTAIVLYIDKVRQNSPKRGFKSTLEHLRQLLCSRTVFATALLLFGLHYQCPFFCSTAEIAAETWERPTQHTEHDFSTCPSLLLLTRIPHTVCCASKETVLSTSSSRNVEICSPV